MFCPGIFCSDATCFKFEFYLFMAVCPFYGETEGGERRGGIESKACNIERAAEIQELARERRQTFSPLPYTICLFQHTILHLLFSLPQSDDSQKSERILPLCPIILIIEITNLLKVDEISNGRNIIKKTKQNPQNEKCVKNEK